MIRAAYAIACCLAEDALAAIDWITGRDRDAEADLELARLRTALRGDNTYE